MYGIDTGVNDVFRSLLIDTITRGEREEGKRGVRSGDPKVWVFRRNIHCGGR